MKWPWRIVVAVLLATGWIMWLGQFPSKSPPSKSPPSKPDERRAELNVFPTTNCAFIGYRAAIGTTQGYNLVVLGYDLEPTAPANQLSIRYSDGTIFRMTLKTNVAYDKP